MSSLDLFLALSKVDLDQRLIQGVATAEAPDRVGEICDYVSTKPYFEAWSAEALKASGGKSLGAVRAMHGRVAAGKLTDIAFDDDDKRILVSARIVDDDEWRKVQEGVYTGFSQGGRYVKRWPDPDTGLTRYTAEPTEISLVDLPCLPGATFEVVKDGTVEKRAFAPRGEASAAEPAQPQASTTEQDSRHREQRSDEAIHGSEDRGAEKAGSLRYARDDGANAGVDCDHSAAAPSPSAALAKAASALALAADKLERAIAENTALRKSVGALAPEVAALAARVATLEAQPLPARAALRATSKHADAAFGEDSALGVDEAIKRLAELAPEARALALTKLSLAHPQPLRF
jgi:hypothetical protein